MAMHLLYAAPCRSRLGYESVEVCMYTCRNMKSDLEIYIDKSPVWFSAASLNFAIDVLIHCLRAQVINR